MAAAPALSSTRLPALPLSPTEPAASVRQRKGRLRGGVWIPGSSRGETGLLLPSQQGWAVETHLVSVPRAARPRPRRPGASPPGFAALPENFSLPSLCTPGFAPQGIWGSDEPGPLLPPMSRDSWVQGALSLRSEPFAPFGMGSPPQTGSSGKASARPSWGLPAGDGSPGDTPQLVPGEGGLHKSPELSPSEGSESGAAASGLWVPGPLASGREMQTVAPSSLGSLED